MKVLSLAGCLAVDAETAKLSNSISSALNAGQSATILKSVDVQSMLRPLGAIDQLTRSNIAGSAAAANDDARSDAPANSGEPRRCRLPGISEVLPSLYLCGAGVAIPCFIEQLQIACVVNAAPELPDTPLPDSRPLYYQVPVLDRGDIDLMAYFDEVADLIEQVRVAGGRTMVHCVAGVSRSASLCLAYLMKHGHMTLREAFEHVRRTRPQIRPNVGFFRQLIEYERLLNDGHATVQFIFVESLAQEIPDVYEPEYRAMELFYQKHRNVKRR